MLDWSDALSVGVSVIDEDHRLLLVVAEALRRALLQREQKLALAGSDVLMETSRVHFRREEELLVVAKFPALEKHQLGHTVFLEIIDQMRFDIERGLWLPAQARLGEACDLLKYRLLEEDQQYGRWLKTKGLEPVYRDLAFAGWKNEMEVVEEGV